MFCLTLGENGVVDSCNSIKLKRFIPIYNSVDINFNASLSQSIIIDAKQISDSLYGY